MLNQFADASASGPSYCSHATEPAVRRLSGIRAKLILILLAFGMLTAVAIFLVFLFSRTTFENAFSLQFETLAAQVNDVIDRNLYERYGDVQAFALNVAVRNPANYRNPSPDNDLAAAMGGYMIGYGLCKLMLLVDVNGEVL